jgi:hypothetical protein
MACHSQRGFAFLGYPRKAGHRVASTRERHGLVALPRPWHILDVRYHGVEAIGKRPQAETRGWWWAIRRVTSAMMQGCPDLRALRRPSTLRVMPWRQLTVAAFHRRGGALQGLPPLGRPHGPLLAGVWRQALGEGRLAQGALQGLQGVPAWGCPMGTARMRHVVCPIHQRAEDLCSPLPPQGRARGVGHRLAAACPPEGHQGCQGGYRRADFGERRVTARHRMALRDHCEGGNRRLEVARSRGRGLGSRVRPAAGRPRQREGCQGAALGVRRLCPSRPLGWPPAYPHRGPGSRMRCGGPSLAAGHRLLGCEECLARWSHTPAQGPGIARHHVGQAGQESGPPQALHALGGTRDARLSSGTPQGPPAGAQGLQPLVHPRVPRGVGALVCHRLLDDVPGRPSLQDKAQLCHKGCVHGPKPLAARTTSAPGLLPPLRRLHPGVHPGLHAPASGRRRTTSLRLKRHARAKLAQRVHPPTAVETNRGERGAHQARPPSER